MTIFDIEINDLSPLAITETTEHKGISDVSNKIWDMVKENPANFSCHTFIALLNFRDRKCEF